jgi:acetyltransferase-like isoleucine patch superfamily enzyme
MLLTNFLKRHSPRQLLTLIAEEYPGAFTKGWPGIEGMALRWLLLKLTAARVGGFSYVYRGVTLTHTYGLSIGKGFHVNTGVHIDARGGIFVGDDVMIGPNTVLVSSDHMITVEPEHTRVAGGHSKRPLHIGNHVWIGANCFLRGGLQVGDHSVIAGGSVVVHDVPPRSVVGGNPARLIRTLAAE